MFVRASMLNLFLGQKPLLNPFTFVRMSLLNPFIFIRNFFIIHFMFVRIFVRISLQIPSIFISISFIVACSNWIAHEHRACTFACAKHRPLTDDTTALVHGIAKRGFLTKSLLGQKPLQNLTFPKGFPQEKAAIDKAYFL